jgi:dTDP-glucose 4,6-dehydratase
MRLLVTGGAGFIGSHFVRSALAGRYRLGELSVTVLDKFTYSGNMANLAPVKHHPRLRVVRGDICDVNRVEPLMAAHDAVAHFAAETHVDRSIAAGADFARSNAVGSQVLFEAASRHACQRFVHVSTDEVYGSIEHGSWSETQPLAPTSPYSASKAASDLLALAYYRTHGLPVMITRGPNTYGPYQYPEKVIPLFVTNLLEGLDVPLYGDGRHVREWLHVDDHCRGVAAVLAKGRPGEIYHIGGGTEQSNLDLTAHLLSACGADWSRVRTVPDRKAHDRRYALNSTKIAGELGWRPRIPFPNGIAETVAWYRDNRSWWEPLRRTQTRSTNASVAVQG